MRFELIRKYFLQHSSSTKVQWLVVTCHGIILATGNRCYHFFKNGHLGFNVRAASCSPAPIHRYLWSWWQKIMSKLERKCFCVKCCLSISYHIFQLRNSNTQNFFSCLVVIISKTDQRPQRAMEFGAVVWLKVDSREVWVRGEVITKVVCLNLESLNDILI